MQNIKFFLDFAIKNSQDLIDFFDASQIEYFFLDDDIEHLCKSQHDNNVVILCNLNSISKSKSDNIINILFKFNNIPAIFLHYESNYELINKIVNYNNAYFFIPNDNFNDLLLFTDFCIKKQNIINELCKNNLIESNQFLFYKSLFNTTSEGIFSINEDNFITLNNERASSMFNTNINDNIEVVVSSDMVESFNYELDEFKKSKKSQHKFETKAVHKIGLIIPVEVSLFKMNIFDKMKYVLIFSDITEKVEANLEIENLIEEMFISREKIEQNASEQIMLNSKLFEQQAELEKLNASKDKFFSIIAHDLKNPFQSLLGYSDILSKDIHGLDNKEIELFASNLNNSAQKLFKLLENLLHWSRIQRDAIAYNPENIDLHIITELNMDLFAYNANKKSITIFNNISKNIKSYSDANMLDTIIRNLLSNALKFTPKNGIITLSAEISDNFVYYKVADTGIGMTDETLQKIFRIDKHHTTPGTDNEEGTGLGLILCYDLALKNKGELFVESTPEKGTAFTIKIPAEN